MNLISLALQSVIAGSASAVLAFNGGTHQEMNESATRTGSLDRVLRAELGIVAGIAQTFRGKPTVEWIRDGGEHEDDPSSRSLQHFHDPLRAWNDSGLYLPWLEPFHRYESSIFWMQEDEPTDAGANGAVQGWSWPDARRSYYHALTMRRKQDREQKWADTFRAVGQIMHLIEDAASPAHVRNDPHGLEYICREYLKLPSCGGNFEYWVADHPGAYSYTAAAPILSIILELPTDYSRAPVPVAHLIDNDIYLGGDANVTVGTLDENGQEVTTAPVGLAEFTNANFFSEDTVSTLWYPFPSLDANALEPVTLPAPKGIFPRQYYAKKAGYGYPVSPLVAEGVFDDVVNNTIGWLAPTLRRGAVDENVWQAYAATLVPKAVVYAQGALDYFFRGRIDFAPDPDDPYGYLIKNLGPEDLYGTFELYYDDADGNRQLVPGANQWQLSIPSAADCPNQGCNQVSVQPFDVPFDTPLGATTYTLVFYGTIGNEGPSGSLGAVAAKEVVMVRNAFLCVASDAVYKSSLLDRGWLRVGSTPEVAAGYYNAEGAFISDHLLLLGPLLSEDGARTARYLDLGFGSIRYPTGATYLGDTSLLATYWTSCVMGMLDFWTFPCFPAGLARSDDLGVSWTPMWEDNSVALLWIAYIGDGTLLGAGTLLQDLSKKDVPQYGLYWSTDGGIIWTPVVETYDGVQEEPPTPRDPFEHPGATWHYTVMDWSSFSWNQRGGSQRVLLRAGRVIKAYSHGYMNWEYLDPPTEVLGSGVYRSTNGVAWQLVDPSGIVPAGVALAPDGSALASIGSVLHLSTDGGQTWGPANAPDGLSEGGCRAIISLRNEVDSQNPGTGS